jgi:VanZ family protein
VIPGVRPDLACPRLWWFIGLGLAAAIATTCLLPASDLPVIGLSDKLKHGMSYALLAFWFASITTRRALSTLAVALLAFGGLIELLQEWMQLGRHAEWADLAANAVGTAGGMALAATPLARWVYRVESHFMRVPA